MKTTYTIDNAHSAANFTIKHMMITKVHGGFENVSGEFQYDESDLKNSYVKAEIDVTTINTKEPQRDAHLKSADFFEVEKYPKMIFESKSFQLKGSEIIVLGSLTIKDVTREVELLVEELSGEVKDPWGNTKRAISAKTKINRKEFGLTWNAALEAGGVLVGEEVQISLDIQFLKKLD